MKVKSKTKEEILKEIHFKYIQNQKKAKERKETLKWSFLWALEYMIILFVAVFAGYGYYQYVDHIGILTGMAFCGWVVIYLTYLTYKKKFGGILTTAW